MQEWMLSFVNDYGYWGIFLLIFVENVFPPIPSEAVLLFGGALTVSTAMNIPYTVLAATAGSLAGAVVLYIVGHALQAERLKRLLNGKLGRVLHLRPEHVDKAGAWFTRYEGKAVLICRCIPVVRSLISVPAGFAGMRMAPFLVLTFLGSAVWNTVLVAAGAALGNAWESALPYFDRYLYVAIAVFAVCAVGLVIALLVRRRRASRKKEGDRSSESNENSNGNS